MTKKSIVIIGPSLKMGGIENSSVNIANSFIALNQKVTFIALFRQSHFFYLHPDIMFIEPSGFNDKRLNLIKSLFWLRRTLKNQLPDSILVFNYFYGAIVRLSMITMPFPIFVSDRSSPLYVWPKGVAFFNHLVYRFLAPAGVIAQTELAAVSKKRFFGKRTRIGIIPNALREVQLYPEITRQMQILAVGRLNDHLKGFDRLIEAFAKIKNKKWKLAFAGGDVEGEALKKLARDLEIYTRIIFLGKLKEIDIAYASSGIFVIPSRSEGFPNALCEAMAAGLPCISFDFIAGPRDIIVDGYNGIIVENDNIQLLANKIDLLIENEEERNRLGQNAKKIRAKLNERKIGQEYLSFILTC